MMTPQKQMASQLIQAFKNQQHVVLESPTGTGKTASILCTTIAWQRHDAKLTGTRTKIIYCSRTHSQLTQAVVSLKDTPYRPRMAIVGSRARLCIHEDSKNAYQKQKEKRAQSQNVFLCQVQNRGTSSSKLPGEDSLIDKTTCPHHDQLESKQLALNAHRTFVPDYDEIKREIGCSDKTSKFGIHDIEDLVRFSKQSLCERGDSLGSEGKRTRYGSGERSYWATYPDNKMEASPSRTLDTTADESGSSQEYACPYYLSRALARDAHLVFAPYNYVIDLIVRESVGLDISDAIVVLDEAHNIENILRETRSGEFSEFSLAGIIKTLLIWSGWTPTLEKDENVPNAAHELSFFVEKIAIQLRSNRKTFVDARLQKGKKDSITHSIHYIRALRCSFNILAELGIGRELWAHTRFEHEFSYDGPPGVHNGEPIGCTKFFQRINITKFDFLDVEHYCSQFISFQEGRGQLQQEFQELQRLVHLSSLALNYPE